MKRIFMLKSLPFLFTAICCTGVLNSHSSAEPVLGWTEQNHKYYYVTEDGTYAVGETEINGVKYVFAPNGAEQTGWQTIDGKRYFFLPETGAAVFGKFAWHGETYYIDPSLGKITGYFCSDEVLFYADEQGVMQTGWITNQNERYFADENACLLTGEAEIDNEIYIFNESGVLQTGWQTDSTGITRYYDNYGTIQTGWVHNANQTSYAHEESGRLTGLHVIDNDQYLFDENGNLLYGFQTYQGTSYYFGKDGKMQTGWQTIENEALYFDGNGLVRNRIITADEKLYYLNEEGKIHHGWLDYNSKTYYADGDGILATGWKRIDGVIYYFDFKGIRQNGIVEIDGKTYLLNEKGIPQVGWYQSDDGSKYYGDHTAAAVTGWQLINQKTFLFDDRGVLQYGYYETDHKSYYFTEENTDGGLFWKGENCYYVNPDGEIIFAWILNNDTLYYIDSECQKTEVDMSEKNNMALAYYSLRKIGCYYWYGTYGNLATEELYLAKKAIFPSYYKATDFKEQYGRQVFDCCGLIKGYLWSDTIDSYANNISTPNVTSTDMYIAAADHGTIDSCPWTIGTLVFRSDSWSTRKYGIHHVGVYIGNGLFVEAKGHNWGVVMSDVPSDWTHWAQCPWTLDNGVESTPNL